MNGVSVARRNRRKPASAKTARRRVSPAWAPSASPTSWDSEFGVQTIVDKVHFKKEVPTMIAMELVRVSKENLGEWAKQLQAWGFTDVPERYLKP